MLWKVEYIRVLPPSHQGSGPWNIIVESLEEQTSDGAGHYRELRQALSSRYPGASERSFDVLSATPIDVFRMSSDAHPGRGKP